MFAVLEAGTTATVNIRNPWSGQAATVIDGASQEVVVPPTTGATLMLGAQQGHVYLIKRESDPMPSPVRVTGTPATAEKALGTRTIGVSGN